VTALDWLAAVLAAIALRGLVLVFRPYRACRWCRPGGLLGGSVAGRLAGRLAGREPGRRRRGRRCWRCKGTRLTRRLGAFHAHKVRQSLRQAWDEREWWR
jgi:hypothetical protein